MTEDELRGLSTDDVLIFAQAETLRGLGILLSCQSHHPKIIGRLMEHWEDLASELERRIYRSNSEEGAE